MQTLTQRTKISSYDIAILGLYTEGVERCPGKRERFAKAAHCTLDCRVSHYAGHNWNVVGSDDETVYRVTNNSFTEKWDCDCPANITCYHIYAVRLNIKALDIANGSGEPTRYVCQHLDGSRGICTPIAPYVYLYVAEGDDKGRIEGWEVLKLEGEAAN